MMLMIHRQLITIMRAMTSLLGDVYNGFGNDGKVCYDFMSKLVARISRYVLIDTGGVI